ncbi:MAG TPA: MgtC/SapB family protein [Candidatus Ozemobacteraceae bacterium]|nr:MgtC/SapB family protein [Candidatus Ozemobacteraceae bacterium]
MLSESEIIFRLVCSALLGGLVGFEREMHSQPAGLRTHVILAIGSTIAMVLSINLAIKFHTVATNGDPERIAAQVISGIGFLGAGAIFRYGSGVKGLTTAASLWTTAIIGLAIGAGDLPLGIAATGLVLFVLVGLDIFEKKFLQGSSTRIVYIKGHDRPWFIREIKDLLTRFGISIKSVSFSKDMQNNLIEIESISKILLEQDMDKMIAEFSKIEGITSFKIN